MFTTWSSFLFHVLEPHQLLTCSHVLVSIAATIFRANVWNWRTSGGGGGKYITGVWEEPDHLKVNSGMVKEKEPTLNTWALDP
jgi:hypothetical protein